MISGHRCEQLHDQIDDKLEGLHLDFEVYTTWHEEEIPQIVWDFIFVFAQTVNAHNGVVVVMSKNRVKQLLCMSEIARNCAEVIQSEV